MHEISYSYPLMRLCLPCWQRDHDAAQRVWGGRNVNLPLEEGLACPPGALGCAGGEGGGVQRVRDVRVEWCWGVQRRRQAKMARESN